MISYVAQILNIFAASIQKTIQLASFIGQLIIITITWIITKVGNVFYSLALFFQIIYEDNVLVITEVPNSATGFMETVYNQLYQTWIAFATLCVGIYSQMSGIVSCITETVDAILLITHEVFLILMKSLIILGDSLWLILTFIPIHLPQLMKVIIKYIFDTTMNKLVDMYMGLLTLTNFLSEVPLESFIGLTSTIIITRMCIYFREKIYALMTSAYWSLVRNMLLLYYMFYNYLTNSEVRVISQMSTGSETRTRDMNLISEEIDDDINQLDSLCVVCQERQKCVLTLPCRHICLCIECCRRLYGYQRTCPICRTFIYHSVTVYL